MVFLPVEQIDWLEAADNYVRIHTAGDTHLVRETMNEFEARLDPARFVRIHRSTIVNLERVRDDHYQIFNAFRRGDAQNVGRLCREHCAATCERLIARLKQESESAAADPRPRVPAKNSRKTPQPSLGRTS